MLHDPALQGATDRRSSEPTEPATLPGAASTDAAVNGEGSGAVQKASLAYLTESKFGNVVLHVDVGTGLQRIKINQRQLANLVSDGARFLRPLMEEQA